MHLLKNINIKTQARWIASPSGGVTNWEAQVLPAPFFRKTFILNDKDSKAKSKVYICGLGYYELYLNGRKVSDHVLDPVVTIYDKHVGYVVYDLNKYLIEGCNVIGVILGNGWYNCHTPDVWHFDKAYWRDYPKLLLQMDINDETVLSSDNSWRVTSGPITFDGLRNGENYDARLELNDWLTPNYDDSTWAKVAIVASPGGQLIEQTMPPCKVMHTLPVANEWIVPDNAIVYDIGQNMTGWARIAVEGESGAEVTIRYGECLNSDNSVDQEHIGMYIKEGDVQTDRYILKGEGLEIWEPRFTYHGFQYIQINISGNALMKRVEGRFVHTAFEQIGNFSCSDENVNRLQECVRWTYLSNFTGIPTDCPHREKNGWTGDAQLAAETGLFNFNAASSYSQWLDCMVDTQRPSGQLPGIVPSSGWGYNNTNGPAWDSALLLIPWYIYLYTGDRTTIVKHYDAMKKYVDYCSSRAENNIVSFGLGDWCHVDRARMVTSALTSTSYYYTDACLLAKFSAMTERHNNQKYYIKLAADIKEAFNHSFYKGDGIYAKGEQTAMGCALYQGLTEDTEKTKVVQKLVAAVKTNNNKPDCGILGAKYIPRALAENGHVELAYSFLTQSDFPGWVNWLKQGATTLWENWQGDASRNHIMFSDISAWLYQYIAGISPDYKYPGFKHFFIKPCPVNDLTFAHGEFTLPTGKIISSWENKNNNFTLNVEVPPESSATIIMPDGNKFKVLPGSHRFNK